jgi:hypothetical protein
MPAMLSFKKRAILADFSRITPAIIGTPKSFTCSINWVKITGIPGTPYLSLGIPGRNSGDTILISG